MLLLAIGYTDVGRYPTLKPDDAKSAVALRKWLKAEFGLVPPKLGTKIVADAQANHPDLGKWIEAWSAKHFATK